MPCVKICGITNLADARAAVKAGADLLGFIFYPKSPRYIPPLKARRIIKELPRRVLKVGVFVNESPGRVRRIVASCGLDIVQFHGDETPAYVKGFDELPVIKAVRVKGAASLKGLGRYDADFFLFDAFSTAGRGGTGQTFDWKLLKRVAKKTPFFVSGGLTPENAGLLLKRAPGLFGVDVSSGVESRPGQKDHSLIRKFMRSVR